MESTNNLEDSSSKSSPDDDSPLDIKRKELDSKQNLRLYLMKSWNVLHSGTTTTGNLVSEFSNSEIRKLLMSPPQSPSINSTSREVATSATESAGTSSFFSSNAVLEEHLDSTNDSDMLVMALEDDHVPLGCQSNATNKCNSSSSSQGTTLKTLKSPLNDGVYTYWAVVKTTTTTAPCTAASSAFGNSAKFTLNR